MNRCSGVAFLELPMALIADAVPALAPPDRRRKKGDERRSAMNLPVCDTRNIMLQVHM